MSRQTNIEPTTITETEIRTFVVHNPRLLFLFRTQKRFPCSKSNGWSFLFFEIFIHLIERILSINCLPVYHTDHHPPPFYFISIIHIEIQHTNERQQQQPELMKTT